MTSDDPDDEARSRDQIAFYREQARQRPSDLSGAEMRNALVSYWDDPEVRRLVQDSCPPGARGLELASGAGRWTGALLEVCEHLTVVDSSDEMHDITRMRNGDDRIDCVVANLFEYQPIGTYDLIFAGYWLSHVPPARFQRFWSMVRAALAPGGRVVMVDDGVRAEDGTVRFAEDPTGGGETRRLADGREFTIVKMAYAPRDLEARLASLGWDATVTLLTPATYVVTAQPAP